jgi:hypothetical protein
MISYRNYLLPALALAALAPQAWADNEVVLRRIDVDSPHVVIHKETADGPAEKESVTYLGVMTGPVERTLSAQLGLPKDTGLVVGNVMKKSPADDLVKRDDVLTKFDDQILVDTHQLSVLVRAKKDGDEVKLTLFREGKELTVKVKLGTHEIPKGTNAYFFQNGGPGSIDLQGVMGPGGMPGLERLRELPGMGADDARDVLRMIEHERGQIFAGPGVRIINRRGKGSTILDLPKSNISYSDDEGSIDIKVDDGKRSLTVKNAKGDVAFQGPINTDDERKKLPPEVMKRLEKLEKDTMSFEAGGDFKTETVPLPPEPAKTKISHDLGRDAGRALGRAAGPF